MINDIWEGENITISNTIKILINGLNYLLFWYNA